MTESAAKHRRLITLAVLAGIAVALYAAILLRFGVMMRGG